MVARVRFTRERVVAASLAKFCGEAAALDARATPMGSKERMEAARRLQRGQGGGEERGENGNGGRAFF
jgi:hypothetical protein